MCRSWMSGNNECKHAGEAGDPFRLSKAKNHVIGSRAIFYYAVSAILKKGIEPVGFCGAAREDYVEWMAKLTVVQS